MSMQTNEMADIIRSSGIGADNATLESTLRFLETHVGAVAGPAAQY
jgi:hypothetical protein